MRGLRSQSGCRCLRWVSAWQIEQVRWTLRCAIAIWTDSRPSRESVSSAGLYCAASSASTIRGCSCTGVQGGTRTALTGTTPTPSGAGNNRTFKTTRGSRNSFSPFVPFPADNSLQSRGVQSASSRVLAAVATCHYAGSVDSGYGGVSAAPDGSRDTTSCRRAVATGLGGQ